MKIKRSVNGEIVEYELTAREIGDAWYEYKHKGDVESVKLFYEEERDEHDDWPEFTEEEWDHIAYLFGEFSERLFLENDNYRKCMRRAIEGGCSMHDAFAM